MKRICFYIKVVSIFIYIVFISEPVEVIAQHNGISSNTNKSLFPDSLIISPEYIDSLLNVSQPNQIDKDKIDSNITDYLNLYDSSIVSVIGKKDIKNTSIHYYLYCIKSPSIPYNQISLDLIGYDYDQNVIVGAINVGQRSLTFHDSVVYKTSVIENNSIIINDENHLFISENGLLIKGGKSKKISQKVESTDFKEMKFYRYLRQDSFYTGVNIPYVFSTSHLAISSGIDSNVLKGLSVVFHEKVMLIDNRIVFIVILFNETEQQHYLITSDSNYKHYEMNLITPNPNSGARWLIEVRYLYNEINFSIYYEYAEKVSKLVHEYSYQ